MEVYQDEIDEDEFVVVDEFGDVCSDHLSSLELFTEESPLHLIHLHEREEFPLVLLQHELCRVLFALDGDPVNLVPFWIVQL